MKTILTVFVFASIIWGTAAGSNTDHPKSERFEVSYVETKELPPLTIISKELDGREMALTDDKRYVAAGLSAAELDTIRSQVLREMYFPIRVMDLKNGNLYELQTDRRTIIARSKDCKELWKVNPYVDSGMKLTPLQASFNKHPYICYYGPPWGPLQAEKRDYTLQITFSTGVFGGLDLRSGKFVVWGSD